MSTTLQPYTIACSFMHEVYIFVWLPPVVLFAIPIGSTEQLAAAVIAVPARFLVAAINYSRLWCCSKRSLWIIVVLHSEARFCSACGATISTAGQETLREFVERDFWPVR